MHRHLGQPYHPARQERTRRAGDLVDQLILEAAAVGGPQVPTVTHPALQRIIANWQQAGALLRQPTPPGQPGQPGQPVPAAHAAVDLRVTRTLAVLAHVTQLSLAGAHLPRPLDPAEAEMFRRMAQRHEQLTIRCLRELMAPTAQSNSQPAGQEAAASRPDVLTSTDNRERSPVSAPRHVDLQVSVPNQLLIGLRQWAPLAIMVAADPSSSARDLQRIARTEATAARGAAALVAAAAQRQELPAESVPHLQQRMESLSQRWREVADQYGWVRRLGSIDPSQTVWSTARACASAIIEATTTGPTTAGAGPSGRAWATPAVIAARFEGVDLIPMVQGIAENSVILAQLYQRIPTRSHQRDAAGRIRPAFYAPEKVLHEISLGQHAQRGPLHSPDPEQESPDVLDTPVTARRDWLRPMSAPAGSILREAGMNLARAATSAERAIELAAGVRPRWATAGLSGTYSPVRPATPSRLSPGMPTTTPGTTPDTGPGSGISR